MEQLIIFITLFIVGYFSGRYFEKNHYKSIIQREKELLKLPVISGEWRDDLDDSCEGTLFSAGVVVGSDYFRHLLVFDRRRRLHRRHHPHRP